MPLRINNTKKTEGVPQQLTEWMQLVQQMRAENPHASYKEILEAAKPVYAYMKENNLVRGMGAKKRQLRGGFGFGDVWDGVKKYALPAVAAVGTAAALASQLRSDVDQSRYNSDVRSTVESGLNRNNLNNYDISKHDLGRFDLNAKILPTYGDRFKPSSWKK